MMKSNWIIYALGSAFFASLTAILGKIGVAKIPSNLATLYRTIVILIVAGLIVSLRSEWRSPSVLDQRAVWALVASGVATGLSWLCYYRALELGPASRVAPIDKLSLVFVLILASIFLGEAMSWKTIAGAILVVLGSIVIAM